MEKDCKLLNHQTDIYTQSWKRICTHFIPKCLLKWKTQKLYYMQFVYSMYLQKYNMHQSNIKNGKKSLKVSLQNNSTAIHVNNLHSV